MIEQLPLVPILLFSVIVHEIAHGWMALRLGDPTARDMGRLTLNPVPHIDLIGSVLIPLMSLAAAGRVFIAWAKPVPVNPSNFAHGRRDDILVSVAGPASNIVLAFLCSIAVVFLGWGGGTIERLGSAGVTEALTFLLRMFYGGMYLNVVLAVFNLIPVPPLDGSHVLAAFLPSRAAMRFQRVGFIGVFVLIAMMRIPACSAAFNGLISGVFFPFQALVDYFLSLSL